MPPIKSINLDDGLSILTSGNLADFSQTTVEIEGRLAGVAGNLKKKEDKFNEWLNQQEPFVTRRPLSDFPPEDPVRNGIFTPAERIDGSDLVIQHFYVAIHILETNPLKITVKTSNSPIGGDWWL
jgi:hypothetical protein